MTVGTATVPAIINADGTWTIDNNGTATTHVFDLDSTLFNFVDGAARISFKMVVNNRSFQPESET